MSSGERITFVDRPGLTLATGWRAVIADDEQRRAYLDIAFNDLDWEPVTVPSHWRTTPAFSETDGPLLYRNQFEYGGGTLDEHGRFWLVLDGIFYTSDVWLDGMYLGDTEGYFFPHQFEVTSHLRSRSEHLLALEVACNRQTDLARKRNLTGVFQHWDMLDHSWNPGGIWRPVRIERSGPVRIKFFRTLCREANDESATVFVRAVLDVSEPCAATFVSRLCPWESAAEQLEYREPRTLAAGENRVTWTLTVPAPRLWWPWSLGEQPLYELTVEVEVTGRPGRDNSGPATASSSIEPLVSDRRTCRLGLRHVSVDNWIFSINGQRLFLKGANQGPTRIALADVAKEEFRRDVDLAREAGLDLLRIHGHISKPELYDAADEAGMLLWQDLPLQWGYSHTVRRQARRQAREAVDLLAHHPSVIVWCGHNEPFAIDRKLVTTTKRSSAHRATLRTVVSTVLPTWNKTVLDHSIKRVLEKTDGSRPAIAHSGVLPHPLLFDGTDTHAYFGWYHGSYRDLSTVMALWPRLARFVSEFGAQAVPSDAHFLRPERWPDLDWDEAQRHHSLQKVFFDRYVPPDRYGSLNEWIAATQRYQADLLRYHIETLRRLKYSPTGGFALFCLADGHPAVSWSILDSQRNRKLGFEAVRQACRPVILVADWLPASPRPGQNLSLDIHVVNDRRIEFPDAIANARLWWQGRGEHHDQSGEMTWTWQGDVPADSVARVGDVRFTLPTYPATVGLDLVLRGPGLDVTNRYETAVDQEPRPSRAIT
ncbi:MAG: hypothetical protein N2037_00990 [Acidimicrobiales bacterium]|nr:hypothetical protein [Acidimicrobiales bacterium]